MKEKTKIRIMMRLTNNYLLRSLILINFKYKYKYKTNLHISGNQIIILLTIIRLMLAMENALFHLKII